MNIKTLKQLDKIQKEEREKASEKARERYKKLNYPLVCPFCNRETNFNILHLHNKTKHCKKIKELKRDDTKNERYANILILHDRIKKLLLNSNDDNNNIDTEINNIMLEYQN